MGATGSVRAVKSIARDRLKNVGGLKHEMEIMGMMRHPNIIRFHEHFEDRLHIHLVMELCSCGDLFDRIIDAGHFTEVQAAIVVQQMIRAILYMHELHVCHRDLKPRMSVCSAILME